MGKQQLIHTAGVAGSNPASPTISFNRLSDQTNNPLRCVCSKLCSFGHPYGWLKAFS